LNEDLKFLEALQSRLHTDASPARHGVYEDRLISAADIYLRLMQGDCI
jgi:hypothetical protein